MARQAVDAKAVAPKLRSSIGGLTAANSTGEIEVSNAMHRRNFLALSTSALIAPKAWAGVDAAWSRDFEKFVTDGLATTNTPGMSVAIVRGGRMLFSRGYGYADVETARRVTADTVFQIASVSKTVTGTAMMMLWQDGCFRLDDPIAPHLDFVGGASRISRRADHLPASVHAYVRHLRRRLRYAEFTPATTPLLRDFLTSYLSPGGHLFDAAKSYLAGKPGTQWSYSNVAVALLGYLAGRVSRDPLDVVTQTRLFAPLGLRNTAWRYAGIGDDRLALPYEFANARFHRLPHATYPDWPAGLLCTSANDFARVPGDLHPERKRQRS